MKKLLDNKIFKVIYNIIKVVFGILLTVYLLFVIFQRVSGNSSIFGYRVFTVATGSMEPVYNVNDVIAVKNVDPSTLKVGDDIAYKGNRGGLEGMLITHRIIDIEKEDDKIYYHVKGVNNDIEDPTINESQIIGKVDRKIISVSILNRVVKNQFGFFFLVFCPLVLVIFLEVAETVIEMKLEKQELVELSKKKDDEDEVI